MNASVRIASIVKGSGVSTAFVPIAPRLGTNTLRGLRSCAKDQLGCWRRALVP